MTEQSFHEIQLSGKQLVFVFMSAVVVAVGIFLLGVSVGRGVRSSLPAATSTAADAGPATEPAPAPAPAASPPPGDPTYHEVLQGKDAKGAPASGTPASGTPPPATAPVPPPPPPATDKGDAKAAEAKAPDSKSAKASDNKGADKSGGKTSAPQPGSWFVQTGLYSTKEAADKQVQQLKAKAFTAFVSAESGPVPRFRVRIGPFSQKGDADRMAARLAKEGHQSFVTR
jgi:DedD protein